MSYATLSPDRTACATRERDFAPRRRRHRLAGPAAAGATLLFAGFVAAPDPLWRAGALWLLVGLGLVASLVLSWRDLR